MCEEGKQVGRRHRNAGSDQGMRSLAVAMMVFSMICAPGPSRAADLAVTGWAEVVLILPEGLSLRAKLDTGAEHSSLHLGDHEVHMRDGRPVVQFRVQDRRGGWVTLTRPIVRRTRIRRHFGATQERPLIELEICLGNVRRRVQVNLVDRSGFDYPLLLGRSFLAGHFLVDPQRSYRTASGCLDQRSGNTERDGDDKKDLFYFGSHNLVKTP